MKTLTEIDAERDKVLSRITVLNTKRSALQSKIDEIDSEIGKLGGTVAKAGKKPAKKAKTTKATKTAKRAKNEKPLHSHITDVLGNGQMNVSDIVTAVQKNGYKTSNKDGLYSQVAVALSNREQFERVERGVYRNVIATVTATAPTVEATATA